ncbi:hypothetical protein LF63_0111700 [Oleiagrimonas soli]|uniref:Uncharacterized protein n=1 Tax=Oleiagrimonas soli TaxID=1543381 RepID=A0A099CW41_9GAMM|nr:hypothetical protein LF63_0111700 [Oleiagrimonas soli]
MSAVFAYGDGIGVDRSTGRVIVQQENLRLKFTFQPVIVAVKTRDVITFCFPEQVKRVSECAQSFRVAVMMDEIGMLRGYLSNDFAGAVIGSVVTDEYLEDAVGGLREHTAQALFDVIPVIAGCYTDRDSLCRYYVSRRFFKSV